MTRITVRDKENGERRVADAEFRAHMTDHLDRVDRQLTDLVQKLEGYHRENTERLQKLEAHAVKANIVLDEWTGGDEPDQGLRRAIRQLVNERRLIGLGWKVLAAFGALGTAVIAAYATMAAFMQVHK